MLPQLFDQLKNVLPHSERGGYYPNIGYKNTDVQAEHAHYVWSPDRFWLTQMKWQGSAKPAEYLQIVRDFAESAFYQKFPDLPLGEICIRIIHYPAQAPKNPGVHTDFCALTVPFDSYPAHTARTSAFYGQAVQDFKIKAFQGLRPTPHPFAPLPDQDRYHTVAFCQLPFDMEDDNGQRYGDLISRYVKEQSPQDHSY